MGKMKPELHSENKNWNNRYWRKGKRGWLHGGKVMSKTARASQDAGSKK